MVDTKTAVDWRGHEMVDLDGNKIGTIVDIYVDSETNEPEWATVKMGLFGIRQTFVPIRNATSEDEIVRVPFEKELVKKAPNMDPDRQLGQDEERDLYGHYGIDYSTDRSASQLPEEPQAGAPESGATAGHEATPGREDPRAPASESAAAPDRTGEAGPGAGIAAGAAAGEGRRTEGDERQGTARDADPAAGTAAGEGEPGESEDDEGRAPAPQPGERGVAEPEEDRESAREDSPGEPGAPAREADAPEVRLRLKKYVVQDEVTIPIQREEIRVEREE